MPNIGQLRREFQQEQKAMRASGRHRDRFYANHPDLIPHATLVQKIAAFVHSEWPEMDLPQLITETVRRVRSELALRQSA